ncbi:copper resistance system multicopper oxidase [Thiohalophilus thiocyanatoxydans]|uniref:CopA family copper-resistance protein n=1 Tax=Thiohalophilus thiocyanatoxydans TaxID=381308 RepID=A0A4R8IY73_9GAMM|nr:copper resistance system multicopper oxidase [Thiohalophilus thiocyanatoxydans]TDY02877.1 CopA family copper-resistance protein [Thiohalophilus thiocyanatoxydans]
MNKYLEPKSPRSPGRRQFLQGAAAMAVLAGLGRLAPAYAWQQTGNLLADKTVSGNTDIFDLTIDHTPMKIGSREANPITINGSVPGPLIRMQEGREVMLRVTNNLSESTSIHWHGILLPENMDGVPGVSFPGIKPGETFVYRYPVKQSGTYWYHSHSGLQEQLGHYGPLIVDPAQPEPFEYDRDYVVMLSDWTYDDPYHVLANLKKAEGYYNYQKRTIGDFFDDAASMGWGPAMDKWKMWGQMRMSSRDIMDVTGSVYTYLINGLPSESNWTALFRRGEKVRLRFINGSAMSFFDVRIPGLKMTVVAADGQNVEPVPVDEFRIGVAETYDVIVEPDDERAYTIFAESMDRSGYVRATLAPREGMTASVPEPRPQPVERGMKSMGMEHGDMQMDMSSNSEMDHSNMSMDGQAGSSGGMDHNQDNMSMEQGSDMQHDMNDAEKASDWVLKDRKITHGPDNHGSGAAMVSPNPMNRMDDPGVGLDDVDHKVLVYNDLRSLKIWPDQREPEREIELHLTGNMERYMWSFDGEKFSEVDGPVQFHHGERLRLILVNDTMMDHPIHLHGMWMELENRHGEYRPRKHTLSLKPGEMLSAQITADAPGDWAFHCHLLYHMKAGMFRVVSVS